MIKTFGDNIVITEEEMALVRSLTDFDLKMLLSEIHDHGWPEARKLMPLIAKAAKVKSACIPGEGA